MHTFDGCTSGLGYEPECNELQRGRHADGTCLFDNPCNVDGVLVVPTLLP